MKRLFCTHYQLAHELQTSLVSVLMVLRCVHRATADHAVLSRYSHLQSRVD